MPDQVAMRRHKRCEQTICGCQKGVLHQSAGSSSSGSAKELKDHSAGRRIPCSAWRVSQLSIFYIVSREAFTTPLLSSNKKSTRRPNGLSVLLRNQNQTKEIRPI